MEVIRTVLHLAVHKVLQDSAFGELVEQIVHRLVLETHVVKIVPPRTMDASVFTVLVAMFLKYELEKCCFVQARRVDEYRSP